MRGLTFSVLGAGLLLAGRSGPANPAQPVNVQAIDLDGRAGRCIPQSDMGIYHGTTELTGDLRGKMLAPEALKAGVRVFIENNSVTTYGSQTVYYMNAKADCILWAEGISLQEYSQRLGLNPIGVSPYYQPDTPKAVPAPTPTPTPTATPSPAVSPTPEAN